MDSFAQMKADLILDRLRHHQGHHQGHHRGHHRGEIASCRLLDVGCGIGLTDALLADRVGELHGIDISQKSLETARENVPNASYKHFDGKVIPFDDDSFDCIIAICVMHHVPPAQLPAFCAEMVRVLKDDGMIFVLEHNPFNPATRMVVARCPFDEDAVLLSRGQVHALFAGARAERAGGGYIIFSPVRHHVIDRLESSLSWLPLGAQYYDTFTKHRESPPTA